MIDNLTKNVRNKKISLIMLILLLIIIGCAIWYKEKGINKEIPKRAIYVRSYKKGSEEYKQGTGIYKS